MHHSHAPLDNGDHGNDKRNQGNQQQHLSQTEPKEGVSKSTFYRWKDQLRDGIPESMVAEKAAQDRAESAEGAAFVPISLKTSPVEIELPNGGIVRLPLGVGQAVLVEVTNDHQR